MSRLDWLKVIVLVLLPINTWLVVLYYLHHQRQQAFAPSIENHRFNTTVRIAYFQEHLGIKEGQKLRYPFPYPTMLFGAMPPVGRGIPVLFLNISWIASAEAVEVWRPTLQEALKVSPSLHIVLLFVTHSSMSPHINPKDELKQLQSMLHHISHPRISVIAGEWVYMVFGGEHGILAFLCDGKGIVRAVEPYPELKVSPYWKEEVADWRPKLHQAVKKVLDKFFPKGQGR